MADPTRPFPPFQEFVNSLNDATHAMTRAMPGAKVADAEAFEEMKRYVAGLYQGVDAANSFMDESGQIFDCVPVQQQPALRADGGRAAPAPPDLPGRPSDQPPAEGPAPPGAEARLTAQVGPDQKDAYGNTRACPPGTIPMRRITLEELARFETLDRFFRKGPVASGLHPRLTTTRAGVTHKYAHAYQTVNNLGGHNFLNVWQPAVGPGQFSLAQHWYAGGSGSNLQTVEVGWQVYPQKYNTPQPCLFIYWTADGYGSTGCYNLDCHAFVQTNPNWTFGGALSPVSTTGGPQYSLEVAFFLYQSNWWLYLGGTDAGHAVGYYPASIFGGGQLGSNAQDIDYGGETIGTTSWPPMGSGAFADAGWQRAAYQRDIYYYPTGGGAQYANLTASQPSPSCYTIALFSAAAPWNRYFFFGGPGGTTC